MRVLVPLLEFNLHGENGPDDLLLKDSGQVVLEVRSRNGKNRTLRHREGSQRSEFTMFNTLVLTPNVVSGEIDVFPAER
jgi:hypothetical protein